MKKIKKKASHHGEGLQKCYNWFKEKVPERSPVSSFEEVPRQVAGGEGDWEGLGFPPSRVLRPAAAALQSEVKLNILSSFYAWHSGRGRCTSRGVDLSRCGKEGGRREAVPRPGHS